MQNVAGASAQLLSAMHTAAAALPNFVVRGAVTPKNILSSSITPASTMALSFDPFELMSLEDDHSVTTQCTHGTLTAGCGITG